MKTFVLYALFVLGLTNCCKPPDTDMQTILIPNTYLGLDSLYSRMAAGDSITIVCYGNSITYGGGITYPGTFQALLRQHYGNGNITVINEGHGGWTAEMAAGGLDTLVLPHQPDLVTLIYGINDLYQEKSLPNYQQHLSQMVQQLTLAQIPVVVMSPTPLYNEANKELLEFCSTASEVAQTHQVAFFHMHAAMVDRIYAETDDPITLMPDEIHYTDGGYQIIGEELMNYWLAKP